jgi:predicted nucleic acid-binding protein
LKPSSPANASNPVFVAGGLAFYDALITASAIEAGCDTLYSKDLQRRSIGGLTIVNPLVEARRTMSG